MTPPNHEPEDVDPPDPATSVRDSDPMLQLLRGALKEPPPHRPQLLARIQERIRRRSRGRYFRDRYSRSIDPVPLVLTVALLLLLVAAAVFLVLQPLNDPPHPIELKPAPPDLMGSSHSTDQPSDAR